jgi:hypothetical protein
MSTLPTAGVFQHRDDEEILRLLKDLLRRVEEIERVLDLGLRHHHRRRRHRMRVEAGSASTSP